MQSLLPAPANTIRNMLGVKCKDAQLSAREYPNDMKLLLHEHEKVLCSTDLGWADGGRGIPKISKP